MIGLPAPWIIRVATLDDANELSALADRTFRAAFSSFNTQADMDEHCRRSYGPALQARELRSWTMTTLVVESDDRLVAYAQVSAGPAPRCIGGVPALEVHRFYVDASWHGTGIAQSLMESIREFAIARSLSRLWLGVWEHNARAIRFYEKCGFVPVGDQIFVVGSDPQRDLVMMAKLRWR